MQVCFGSFVPAAAVVLNPKESIHWGYTLAAAVVMAVAAGWTVFVLTVLWLHCSDDHAQCSYTALSGSAESQTPTKFSEKSDCPLAITESESIGTSSDVSLTCIATRVRPVVGCVASERSIFSDFSEGEETRTQNSEFASPPEAYPIDSHASDQELDLAKRDAATEELLKLRMLFAMPVVAAVVLPKVDAGTEPDPEPEPFELEAFQGDAVLAESDGEVESDGNQDDTWAACWQASGWGDRGIWSGGAIQGEAEHCFDEMTVTYLYL